MTKLTADFFDRPVLEVAPDLVGCILRHGDTAGVIVETEAYHESEPSCHAHAGRTARARVLFDGPGTVYVYRSYGIHALVNLVTEPEDIGAAVLIRALQPLDGIELMQKRRGTDVLTNLCSGPGKLTQALGIELHHNETNVENGPIIVEDSGKPVGKVVVDRRIGISKAADLPWRFLLEDSQFVSRRHRPAPMIPFTELKGSY